jgi:hypothetical protein
MYTERRARLERRSEPRYPLAGTVFWRKPGTNLKIRGLLSDTSISSVSFITAEGRRPSVDEYIELTGPDHSMQWCRVARTAPYDRTLSLIACEAPLRAGCNDHLDRVQEG